MACPSSGEISLKGIYNELTENDYDDGGTYASDMSLKNLSTEEDPPDVMINTRGNDPANRPDTVAPHAMSEFYSYDHDAR